MPLEIDNAVNNIRRDCNNRRYILQKVSKESPEDLADGVFVFHNPNARNKIHESLFNDVAVTQFFMEKGSLKYKGNSTPIVLRSNNCILGISEYELQEAVRMFNRYGSSEGYDYLNDIRSFGDTVYKCSIKTSTTHN